jgi:hypothetical protein
MMSILFFILLIITQSESYKEKFCFNCKYFIQSPDQNTEFGKCKMFPNSIENNNFLVTGQSTKDDLSYRYCSTARSCDSLCGPYGHYHVRRYKKK